MVALFAQQSNIVEFPQPQGKSKITSLRSMRDSEYYTPSRYIEAARKVMGSIDLDPASCEQANQIIRATQYYSQREDGLVQHWYGNIWLNPPFGRMNAPLSGFGGGKSIMGMFTNKLVDEYEQGNVNQAILLTTPKIDTAWFTPLWQYPICFATHRVLFKRPKQEPQGHFYGTCFIYMGKNEQSFIDIFSQFGTVARRVSTPKVQPVNLSLWEVQ